ncbi:MAG: (deoxy)nucleoside triphosphate pyrophosphohydrolase [Candidatus Rokubacteria bacterium]|nr:(deoxy)nucleoside triphosphate pyrophosphohydrolase [Candidatus Rokubacteria bacterium]
MIVEVAAGLIQDGAGRYLITRRQPGSHLAGLWEFPGGKRMAGESLEACLRRELSEELSATFAIAEPVDVIRWDYPDKTVILHFFRCRLESGTIEPRESQAMAWVEPERLDDYPFPPADRTLIERLRASGGRGRLRGSAPGAPGDEPREQDEARDLE